VSGTPGVQRKRCEFSRKQRAEGFLSWLSPVRVRRGGRARNGREQDDEEAGVVSILVAESK
jgi:hypothetical protein